MKEIDLNDTVFTIVSAYPEVRDALVKLGFEALNDDKMLHTAGRMMTLARGAKMMGIDQKEIVAVLERLGYGVKEQERMTESKDKSKRTQEFERRQAVLKDLILRLHAGEDSAKIKQEFQEHFANVSALEISVMERGLLAEGIEVEEIQRLCNIHASLFAGAVAYDRPVSEETEKPGHPVRVLKEENLAIESALDRIARLLEAYLESKDASLKEGLLKQLGILWEFDKHYARKEYAFFPIMERYGMTAPPKVMWGVDDEIRAQFKEVRKLLEADQLDGVRAKFDALKYEMAEMVIKEEEILIPMVSDSFSEADWLEIAAASEEIGYCIVRPEAKWAPKTAAIAGVKEKAAEHKEDGDVHFETGHLSVKELEKILDMSAVGNHLHRCRREAEIL